ncbi:uncharacterized protein I206_105598 [Kwoniella pini CBS 10737]|uniref:Uncharacterized protein n=1 Tax=Kwoniella pini CBS 10737 TaxID=1296096 RepID=A0AAJ8L8R2_9TREE
MGRLQHSLTDFQLNLITFGAVLLVLLTLSVMYSHFHSMQRRYPTQTLTPANIKQQFKDKTKTEKDDEGDRLQESRSSRSRKGKVKAS